MINILFTAAPVDIIDYFTYCDHLYRWCAKNLSEKDFKIKFLMTEKAFDKINDIDFIKKMNPIKVTDSEIDFVFQNNYLSDIQENYKFYFEGLNSFEQERFNELVKNKLDDYIPDIIINLAFQSTQKAFSKLFPNALKLNQENAIFSRHPFKRTLAYDPFGCCISSLYKFKDDIKNFKITDEQNKLVENFKNELKNIIEEHSPIKDILKDYKNRFKKLALVPLTGTEFNTKTNLTNYQNDFDILEYIFSKADKETGIIVTEHDQKGILDEKTESYFKNKYPNFIFLKETNKKGSSANSLHYFNHVDIVFNTISKTGLSALLWDKPVISLAQMYNDLIKDFNDIDEITSLSDIKPSVKNNIIYWYFTRYLLYEDNYCNEEFLKNYFSKKLEKFRKEGITFNFFEQINDEKEIFNKIIKDVKENYSVSKEECTPKTLPIIKSYKEKIPVNFRNYHNLSAYFKVKVSTKEFNDRLNLLIEKYKNKKVLIYGTKENFKFLNENYKLNERLNIIAIVDEKLKTKNQKEIKRIKLISPNDIKKENFDNIIIIDEYYQPILTFLEEELSIPKGNTETAFFETIQDERENINYLAKFNFEKNLIRLKKKLKNKKIMLYGAGIFAQAILTYFDLSDLNIIGISDKKFDYTDKNCRFMDYSIYEAADITKINPDYVLISTKYTTPIWEDLYFGLVKDTKIKLRPLMTKGLFANIKEFL